MSVTQPTNTRLRELRLAAMAEAYERQLQQPKLHQIGFDDRFGMLVEAEASARESRKLKRLVRGAGLPDAASFEELDDRASRGLDKPLLASLAQCEWVRRQQNLILVGATGVGKTWLACAFGHQACRLRLSVSFYRVSDLCEDIATAAIDGSLPDLKKNLGKSSLLILDDLGIGTITAEAAEVLLQVVDRRMRTGSLLITSQFPGEKWHGLFPDPTIADAILDRVVHQAHSIKLKGESMRKTRARKDAAVQ